MGYVLKEITTEEFRIACLSFPAEANFAQSEQMGNLRGALGWDVRYIALFCDEHPCCVGMAALSDSFAPVLDFLCGPHGDFHDPEVCQSWTHHISIYAKSLNAASVRMNPNLIYQKLKPNGTAIETTGSDIITNLQNSGWQWDGLTIATPQPRFLYIRDLADDYQSTFASFAVSARTAIRRAREHGLTIRRACASELSVAKEIFEETAARQGFQDRTIAYYDALFKSFGDDAILVLVELDAEKLIRELSSKIAEYDQLLNRTKATGKIRQINDQKSAAVKLLEAAEKFPETNTVTAICAGVFIHTSKELVYLFGGTKTAYMCLQAVYLLQEEMMKYCIDAGIKRYNFYGVSGSFDSANPTYGVLSFKQAFGGYIEELVGDFRLILNPTKVKLHSLTAKLLRLIRH